MLKGLKKDGKKQVKKDTVKEKLPKNEVKNSKEQQEQDPNDNLVEINYDQKQTAIKTVKKVQNSKLQEKQIDTSNIIIEKKEEKKAITSWIVQVADIKNMLVKDFKLQQHETDFQSLTDQTKNKELAEKAKKELQSPTRPKVIEQGGLKFAQLQNNDSKKQQELVISKKVDTVGFISNIPIQVKETPLFVNTNPTASINFAPLEKTSQQLKEEEAESTKRREPDLVLKTKNTTGWIGAKIVDKKSQAPLPEFKVSQWAVKGSQGNDQQGMKFAPIVSNEPKSFGRKEQEYIFTNKKQVQQRRKAKQEATGKVQPTKITVDVNKM